MGLGNTVKAIWVLLQGTTDPNVQALYNNLYQQLEAVKIGSSSKNFARNQVGTIYFVNGGSLLGYGIGDNDNDGLTPATAFLTITYALTQCTDWNNDYIYCFNVYNQEPNWPVEINVQTVHVIGVSNPDGHQALLVPAVADAACFEIPTIAGAYSGIEIAGFNLAAGATHGCIEVEVAYGLWIHNCCFGHHYGFGGQDGIRFTTGTTSQNIIIEDCWFWGTEDGEGWLSQFGISAPAAPIARLRQCTIRNNYFSKLPTGAISLLGLVVNSVIEHNIIGCGTDALGDGIDLGATTTGNLIAHNSAGRGNNAGVTHTANPFQDVAAAANDNDWMCNQWAVTMTEPD